ncbi:unnamed protein product (macronuclear) [Paramecium tetraurelia]|uniref:CDT1 Geminin-binding domain-containing protein n=1 Tax=Paramecium tetraurelia TaxID=5888 RepID=A0C029_PARTE|nr:uncharacterized protein GSPATT00005999001 [Paramecium tetraurelia]CAK64146.1 unnamed protein product [Paramecium tetraurelia]|eukprot:XP_001431544.1 hypothetical protein (macronuclear) [Paramecium tetraurelia strain d4-2]
MSQSRIGVNQSENSDYAQQFTKKEKKEAKEKSSVQCLVQKGMTKNKSLQEDSLTINSIEQFENYKKMVKLEQKRESAIAISRILFKGPLRQRFERLDSIKSIQQLLTISKYQLLCKMFLNLNKILINQTLAFQEIVIQFKQDYQIEFKVQFLQQLLTIWNDAFFLSWKHSKNDKVSLEVGINDQQFDQNEDKNITFQQKLLNYIQKKGECIELFPLPNIQNIQQSTKLQGQDQQECQKSNSLRQIAKQLQQYFQLRDVSNMYLMNVEKYLIKQKFDLNSNNGILSIVNELMFIYPEWINLIQGEKEQIVRINRSIDIQQLMQEQECLDCN